ncbi:MAG: 3-hydroxyacyl-CoA dehydrogenase family protein [Acidimicrobiia bacterium]|nr:3-hydroxyacyl-CoA dehydrogenase family protein [Acidimicrobiia bacterium]
MTERVGIVGAGLMGAGIGQVFAAGGYTVVLHDVDPEVVESATARIGRDLDKGVELGKVDRDEADAILERLVAAREIRDLSGCELVVEAVAERLDVKQQVFEALDEVCPAPALLLSNTSTLSVTEIASVLEDPRRAAGLHFFNPPPRMRLVEIVPGYDTSEETVERLYEVAERIDKTPVLVNESPGGIVSRLQLLVRNEAIRLLTEGVASAEDIDTAMKLGSGWPLGPLELTDLVGLDIHVNNSDSLAEEMGDDRYRPPPLVRKMVRAGHLGRKTGQGFRDHGEGT